MIVLQKLKPIPYHPCYAKDCTAFNFYQASYDAGCDYKNSSDADGEPVFIAHENESSQNEKARKRMSTFLPYTATVVNRYNNFVYVNPIKRDITNERFSEWCKDVDLVGTCLHDFMKRCSLAAQILGRYFIIAETTKLEWLQTQDQAAATGNRMYLIECKPSRVINWTKVGQATTEVLIHFPDVNQVRLYTKDAVQIAQIDDQGKIAAVFPAVPHGFGFMPVVEVTVRTDGLSQVRDIAEANKKLFNLDSLLMEELYKQTFTTAFISGVSSPNDLTGVSIGSRKFIVVKPREDGSSAPFTVTKIGADTSQAGSIQTEIEKTINHIYQMAGLLRQDTIEKGDRASGLALSIRFSDIANMAGSIADHAEKAENKVLSLYRVAYNDETVEDSEYPDNDEFETQEFASELKSTLDMLGSPLPMVLKQEQVRHFAHKFYPDLDADQQKDLEESLEEIESEPEAKPDNQESETVPPGDTEKEVSKEEKE